MKTMDLVRVLLLSLCALSISSAYYNDDNTADIDNGGEMEANDEFDEAVNSVQLQLGPPHIDTEDYYCTSVTLPSDEQYITGFEPDINSEIAHHMLLFGCEGDSGNNPKYWNCKRHGVCGLFGRSSIIYAWAKGAPGFKYPTDVGYRVGTVAKVRSLVMQVHFHHAPSSEKDHPRLNVKLTSEVPSYVAGIFLLGANSLRRLPPGHKDVTLNIACKFQGPNDIVPIGFRTHAHSLSPLILGYIIPRSTKKWMLIGHHSPQEPQAFYPVENNVVIHRRDILAAQCHYDTRSRDHEVTIGSDSINEMCNFYIMYYMRNNGKKLTSSSCWSQAPSAMKFPDPGKVEFPTGSTHTTHGHDGEDHAHDEHHTQNGDSHVHDEDGNNKDGGDNNHQSPPANGSHKMTLAKDWPMNWLQSSSAIDQTLGGLHLGQVSGISVDSNNTVYLFHRGHHTWNYKSFNLFNEYTERDEGPITEPAILMVSPNGTLLDQVALNLFYLPHGLTVDSTGLMWLTDVARHQIFKVSLHGRKSPLVLGKSFKPGHDLYHFCKPTSVAVDMVNGRFYVADGYCNHRISVHSIGGQYITQYSSIIDGSPLNIPHSLALSNDGSELYVADRENKRIIRYNTSSGDGSVFTTLDGPVYAISFSNGHGDWPLYAINGSMGGTTPSVGFTIGSDGVVIDTWSPSSHQRFGQPHDIAVNNDGTALYVAEIGPNKVWKFDIKHSQSSSQKKPASIKVGSPHPSSHVTTPIATPTPHPSSSSSCLPLSLATYSTSRGIPVCPRPPPPPTSQCCSSSSSSTIVVIMTTPSPSCSPCTSNIESTHHNVSNPPPSFPIGVFGGLMAALIGLLLLVMILLVAIRCYKRSPSPKRPVFNVRRFYSRNPTIKRLNGSGLLTGSDRKGFTQIRTYDSETDEEITVFQKT